MFTGEVYEYHVRNFILQKIVRRHFCFEPSKQGRKIRDQVSQDMTQMKPYRPEMIEMMSMVTTQWLMNQFMGWIDDPEFLLPILDLFILG